MNNKLRKQFENIAEIKEMLLNNDELKWCDESKRYINSRVFQDAETGYINGALFGWIQSANREGYKLMPVEPTRGVIDKAVCDTPETPSQDYWHSGQPISDDQAIACYKAMIGAIE